MKNKLGIIGVVVGIIVLGGGLFWFMESRKNQEITVSPQTSQISTQPTEAQKLKTLTWNDPAGFTFQYSEGIKINNHPEDKVNYANLEMTYPGKDGKILILASDTTLKKISDWEKASIKTSMSTLGGKEAKIETLNVGEETIAIIDSGILFTIKMTPGTDSAFWQKTFDQIISSFKLTPPPTSSPSSGTSGTSGGDITEEEEIIE